MSVLLNDLHCKLFTSVLRSGSIFWPILTGCILWNYVSVFSTTSNAVLFFIVPSFRSITSTITLKPWKIMNIKYRYVSKCLFRIFQGSNESGAFKVKTAWAELWQVISWFITFCFKIDRRFIFFSHHISPTFWFIPQFNFLDQNTAFSGTLCWLCYC